MSDIQQGLLIAGIGMGLVFVMILFLWGLMALMMRLTSGGKSQPQADEDLIKTEISPIAEIESTEKMRQAAVAAVAAAMALGRKVSRSRNLIAGESTQQSTWQTFHRARQLENRRTRG